MIKLAELSYPRVKRDNVSTSRKLYACSKRRFRMKLSTRFLPFKNVAVRMIEYVILSSNSKSQNNIVTNASMFQVWFVLQRRGPCLKRLAALRPNLTAVRIRNTRV